jgi:serine protease
MSKIGIYLWACAFFGIVLSADIAAEETLEEVGITGLEDSVLSPLLKGLLAEKSQLPLNTKPHTSATRESSARQTERQASESDALRSEFTHPPALIAEGIIVRFKSPEIQDLARANLPPPKEVVAELEAALGEKLVFHGAMVNEAYVFRFLTPKEGEEAISSFLQRARSLPGIEWIEADTRVKAQSLPNDTFFDSYQWNMKGEDEGSVGGINATRAWSITRGSSDTIVAVVDTGVRPHPEFAARLLPGYDFVSNPYYANDGDGIDSDASDPGDWIEAGECGSKYAENSSWHGTHVAGIIAASGDNGLGIAGVDWNTRILPVRVLGKCGGNDSDILNGMAWAVGLPVPGVPPNPFPAQIINLSLGGYGECPRSYQEAINRIVGQGALVVVAAGNKSIDVKNYLPANCEGVLTVVATDHKGEFASYTNLDFTAVGIGIAAPGGDIFRYDGLQYGIFSTIDTGATTPQGFDYDWKDGTSMAAPHVSGIASLALSVNSNLSGEELYFLLQLTSKPFPAGNRCATYGICGVGIADAYMSVMGATALKNYRLVYEFYNVDLNHYFLTGSKEDAAIINRGGAGSGWYGSGNFFYMWSGPQEGALPVCRFYTQGANSHFYTANLEDCAYLKSLNPANVLADDQWTYEGVAFYAKLPINGICPSDSAPIYRVYNNRWREDDSNHRFVSSSREYAAMISKGWIGEGVTLCAAFAIED